MSERESEDLTQLLQRWTGGDAVALDELVAGVYPDLRVMASRFLSRERAGTLQATALVHDLYLKLLKQQPGHFENRRAFFAFAAGVMRHILVDQVRARRSQKRGADRERVPLSDDLSFVDADSEELLDMATALDELRAIDPRKAELVELCAFLGCSRSEAADLLGVSLPTVKRDFRIARAWLADRLGRAETPVSQS
jgi:RNA polymerase sigma factor (TIGR02999 family)